MDDKKEKYEIILKAFKLIEELGIKIEDRTAYRTVEKEIKDDYLKYVMENL